MDHIWEVSALVMIILCKTTETQLEHRPVRASQIVFRWTPTGNSTTFLCAWLWLKDDLGRNKNQWLWNKKTTENCSSQEFVVKIIASVKYVYMVNSEGQQLWYQMITDIASYWSSESTIRRTQCKTFIQENNVIRRKNQ